jgi:hypothetical protein
MAGTRCIKLKIRLHVRQKVRFSCTMRFQIGILAWGHSTHNFKCNLLNVGKTQNKWYKTGYVNCNILMVRLIFTWYTHESIEGSTEKVNIKRFGQNNEISQINHSFMISSVKKVHSYWSEFWIPYQKCPLHAIKLYTLLHWLHVVVLHTKIQIWCAE